MTVLNFVEEFLEGYRPCQAVGRISAVNGILVESEGVAVKYGELVHIKSGINSEIILAQIKQNIFNS